MLKNNNQAAIKRLTRRFVKNNRTRNIFAVIAIILTTYMISTVFSIGLSFSKNYTIMQQRMNGTLAFMSLENPTPEQVEKIKSFSGLRQAGIQIMAGMVPTEQTNAETGSAPQQTLSYYDETEFHKNFLPCINDMKGNYPEATDEIMMSLAGLKLLGIEQVQLGMEVPFAYTDSSGLQRSETFRLSGYYTDYTAQTGHAPVSFVSQAYCSANSLTAEKNGALSITAGILFQKSLYQDIQQNAGLAAGQELTAFDLEMQSVTGILGAAGVIVMLVLFIVLSGYLLIYNVIYISVTRDIRFYGLLKTIGVSPKQIKKIVRNQIFLLSLIGIPIGVGLGILTSFAIVPYAMRLFENDFLASLMPSEISFHPLVFIGTAFFALLTIVLSSSKPAKTAAQVAPIEALKYTGVTPTGKMIAHQGTKGGKPYKIAWYNIFREKKRAILVFASLFMGTITFLTVHCFLNSMGVENYLNRYFPNDFEFDNISPLDQDFDQNFLQRIKDIDGVKKVEASMAETVHLNFNEHLLEPLLKYSYDFYFAGEEGASYESFIHNLKANPANCKTWLNGVVANYITQYNKEHGENLDVDAFERGDYCMIGYTSGPESIAAYRQLIGKTLTLTNPKTGQQKDVKIGGVFSYSDGRVNAYIDAPVGMPGGLFVSHNFMNTFFDDPIITGIKINIDRSKEPQIKSRLTELSGKLNSTSFKMAARSDTANNFSTSMQTMNVLGGGISILLILVGLINFINVMLTGVYIRRKELAVLESVGMTKKQIQKMLTFEGLYYAVLTLGLILTVGNLPLHYLSQNITAIADYAVFHYPFAVIASIAAVILAVCLAVPSLVFRTLSKESVTERLHENQE